MSDMLSQDEINALLSGLNNDVIEDNSESAGPKVENYLSSIEQDALGEIGNISFGSAATALSTLLNQKVDITTPKVSVIEKKKLEEQFPQPHVAIHVKYTKGFEGTNLLVIKTKDAAIIANLMLGGNGLDVDETELGEMEISAVQEAMNQMMGSASTSMSTIFNKKVDISPPGINLMNVKVGQGTSNIPDEHTLVKISFSLKIGSLIDSQIMQLVTVSFAKDLVDQLMNPSTEEEGMIPETIQVSPSNQQTRAKQNEQQTPVNYSTPDVEPQQSASDINYYQVSATQRLPQNFGGPSSGQHQYQRDVNVQPVAFSSFESPSLNDVEAKNLNMLLDIQLQVTVELGRTKRSIKEILELSQGSIIELDKLAGEPVDILVNDKLIAKGEVVVIDENFGVRVTDIVSQTDRLKNLK
ncbi:flagellar motor switch phosphatase FliY [Anaerobacillus sp. CMMVII]|uniref:flagellar motor switch phosphatase FliY n=1 Tax=Anaerobacillus sp. CMMVII TaxID=2755588 RepID=UPI0021B81B0B|nr:flagellar motor switch phosphatase FliY [Anaerobacillus sp. CMMVII]MCT8139831.1 flagellar motor switch phosphatase FliY [Anaerobacillus sp. CMMVII]